jgi:hypothetical protein
MCVSNKSEENVTTAVNERCLVCHLALSFTESPRGDGVSVPFLPLFGIRNPDESTILTLMTSESQVNADETEDDLISQKTSAETSRCAKSVAGYQRTQAR